MDGVVRAPSAFSMTLGALPSMTATHELVVPRSMPITFAILLALSLADGLLASCERPPPPPIPFCSMNKPAGSRAPRRSSGYIGRGAQGLKRAQAGFKCLQGLQI